uniref:Uncharacterized protein n=1 Tax=Pipistrellus kuhlii TaxID=59472 RepID=A0A7J7TP49_PIPKU|nr:hypothetical protein mPipKuh1_009312 [Pipistrellus kuhlii]
MDHHNPPQRMRRTLEKHHEQLPAANGEGCLLSVPKWGLSPQCEGIGRWGFGEMIRPGRRGPGSGVPAHMKETPSTSGSLVRTRRKYSSYQPGGGASLPTGSAGAMMWVPGSRTMRFLVTEPPSMWYSVRTAQSG